MTQTFLVNILLGCCHSKTHNHDHSYPSWGC